MNPDACFQAQQQCQQLPRIGLNPSLQAVQQGDRRLIRNQRKTEADPAQQHDQPESRADQRPMGPEGAMGDQTPVGPPEKAERPPAAKSNAAGIEIRGQPEAASKTGRCSDQSCMDSEDQADHKPAGQAPELGGSVMSSA